MEGDEGTDDLPTVTEDIGLPTPPSPGRVPPPNLPPADPGEGDIGGERPAPAPPGDEA
ncbi:hypothetical protein [Methylobacterium sp. XJLW]|jgi:hypothetical protein|uniref:hypothetical protein n=1 Tax=Methylobacterium sp. XJLW TaxID=739141 RepID=UPI0013DFBBF7|nr:hypothetical protein [Methylobacterium sp. XJLW]